MCAIHLPASVALHLCEELAGIWCAAFGALHGSTLGSLGLVDVAQREHLRQLLNRRFCIHLNELEGNMTLGDLLLHLHSSLSWRDDAHPPRPPYHF